MVNPLITLLLQVKPQTFACTKRLIQVQVHLCCGARVAVDDARQRGAGYADVLSELRHGQIRAFDPGAQEFAGMAGVMHGNCVLHIEIVTTSSRHRLNISKHFLRKQLLGHLDFVGGLQVHPALYVTAEVARDAHGGVDCDAAPFEHNVVDA